MAFQPKDIQAHRVYQLGPNTEAWVHGIIGLGKYGEVTIVWVKGGPAGEFGTTMPLPDFARKARRVLGTMTYAEACAANQRR